jgi:hypothetical protein
MTFGSEFAITDPHLDERRELRDNSSDEVRVVAG